MLAKQRIWETSVLSCQTASRAKIPTDEVRNSQTIDLLSAVFNMKFLLRYDKQYNRDEVDFSDL